jgi:hypothetical protein
LINAVVEDWVGNVNSGEEKQFLLGYEVVDCLIDAVVDDWVGQ